MLKLNFGDTNGKGEMEFNAPFKYFSHIELTEGHVKVQNCKGSALLYEEFRLQRDSNPAPLGKGLGFKFFIFTRNRGFIAHSISLLTAHYPDSTEIVLSPLEGYSFTLTIWCNFM